jgi:oxygen-independent coproporphyrinogen-3 oxidase
VPPPRAPVDRLTGLSAARFAVYVHFPYCLSKCPYCDFASTAAKQLPEVRYTAAILNELKLRAASVASRPVEAIFFGGGTPSLWSPIHVGEVLSAIAKTWPIAEGCEVTLEANPGASDAERFAGYRGAGVNRLSVGIQSFDPATLARLGRAHDGATARRAIERAREAGFENVSADFIYGVHGQSLESARRDAEQAVELGTDHLSAYALTLDSESLAEEVPLAKQLARGEVVLPPDGEVIAMQRAVSDVYRQAGLERYEISNYARPGYHSRHNATYWTGGDWLALGVGATGSVGTHRYANHRSAERYLDVVDAGQLPERSAEQLSSTERFEERIAMGLRLVSGVDLAAACAAFEQDVKAREPFVARLVSEELARVSEGRLQLTERGFDLHSAISARLM